MLSLSGNQVFPEVTRLLTSHTGNTSNSEDILSSACYTVRNLMASQPQMAKQYFTSSMVNNVINLCRSRWAGQRAVSSPAPHTPSPFTPRRPSYDSLQSLRGKAEAVARIDRRARVGWGRGEAWVQRSSRSQEHCGAESSRQVLGLHKGDRGSAFSTAGHQRTLDP